MAFVSFDVYSTQALGLNGADADAVAVVLDRLGSSGLAGRVRYGLLNETLVELTPEEREPLADALDALLPDAANQEQVGALARNLRARIAGADIL